ncbi:hypothetical protein ACVXHA_12500 [Escherichia coli]
MLPPPRVLKPLPVPIPKWCRPRAQWCSRGQQLQREIAERGQYFGWQSLVLFLVSLVMVLLFTRMIIGPVKKSERMINRLGEGRSLGDSVSFR